MSDFYTALDGRIRGSLSADTGCRACGKCCDFDSFDHRLFITQAELFYLEHHLQPHALKPMPGGVCPYRVDAKCSIHEHRFAGCRIFFCSGDERQQSETTEWALSELRRIHTEFKIDYRYMDLATALNTARPHLEKSCRSQLSGE